MAIVALRKIRLGAGGQVARSGFIRVLLFERPETSAGAQIPKLVEVAVHAGGQSDAGNG